MAQNHRLLTITSLSGNIVIYNFLDLIRHRRWPLHSPVSPQKSALAQVRVCQSVCVKKKRVQSVCKERKGGDKQAG